MTNRDLFAKDPLGWRILNEGVTSNNVTDVETLKYELSTFVCEGEYQVGLGRILEAFLSNLGKGDQSAVWVSGFYGSGKSHLVKVLRYLWTDTPFEDGTTPRSLAKLPNDIKEKLKELSTKAKQNKTKLEAAGGTLGAGVGSVRLRLLGIVFNSLGIPENYSTAKLWIDLRKDGHLDEVLNSLLEAKKDPQYEFDHFYTSAALHKAYLKIRPDAGSLENVKAMLRAQYPPNLTDISTLDMLKTLRLALSKDGKNLPLTVVVLDEVQQFINQNAETAFVVQEAVEACSKQMDGRVLFVGTGQSALNETPSLQRLMGRFTIKVPLKDTDVQAVVRTVVLQKKDEKKGSLKQEIDSRSGEITRQLKDTRLATRNEDSDAYIPDYPLLPVRRRFWDSVLQHVDTTGTTAQMRTQLRVIHEACRSVAEKPVGSVIPADFLYQQLAPDLIQSGEIQKRFSEIIEEQKKKPDGELRSRVCALIYLVNKLPRQADVDQGIRAHVDHLADLLCDDLKTGVSELRQKLPALLKDLVNEGVLMEVDQEFRLQTTEGASWEAEFRRRRSGALANEPQLASQRNLVLQAEIQNNLGSIKPVHGKGKVSRKLSLHLGSAAPSKIDGLVVWVRDGYSESESSVMKDIQAKSQEDATIHVFIPKGADLRNALADKAAASETINFKGHPTTPDGVEAKKSIESRQGQAEEQVAQLARAVFRNARVYLSGGTEVQGETPKEAVTQATARVMDRLYPKFEVADHANWHLVHQKAKEGNAQALESIAYKGDVNRHPVAVEILNRVGGGIKGNDLVEDLGKSPFGWSSDAVVGTVVTLVVSGHLKAIGQQGKDLANSELDHKKVNQATLHKQHPVLTAMEMLRVKGLFTKAGQPATPGQESVQAVALVDKLKNLAASAGGEAPAPIAPKPPILEELSGLTGNDLLFKLFENHESLVKQIETWQATTKKLEPRLRAYQTTRQLLNHSRDLPEAAPFAQQLKAVEEARSLLDDPDPITGIQQGVTALLQQSLKTVDHSLSDTFQREREKLESNSIWKSLPETKRAEILSGQGLQAPTPVDPSANLLDTLSAGNLEVRKTRVAALPTRFQDALHRAIQEAEPKASKVHLPSATLKTSQEVDAWLEKAKASLLAGLEKGPVIVG